MLWLQIVPFKFQLHTIRSRYSSELNMATAIRLQTIPDAIENSILLFYSLCCFYLLRKLFRFTIVTYKVFLNTLVWFGFIYEHSEKSGSNLKNTGKMVKLLKLWFFWQNIFDNWKSTWAVFIGNVLKNVKTTTVR